MAGAALFLVLPVKLALVAAGAEEESEKPHPFPILTLSHCFHKWEDRVLILRQNAHQTVGRTCRMGASPLPCLYSFDGYAHIIRKYRLGHIRVMPNIFDLFFIQFFHRFDNIGRNAGGPVSVGKINGLLKPLLQIIKQRCHERSLLPLLLSAL